VAELLRDLPEGLTFRELLLWENDIWNLGYHPFLSLLYEIGTSISPRRRDELIQQNAYAPQRSLFHSLLTYGRFEREDPLFDFELEFERQKFAEGVAGIISEYHSRNQLLIHLLGVEQLYPRAIQVMREILVRNNQVYFIATISDMGSLEVEAPGRFSDLIRRMDMPQFSLIYPRSESLEIELRIPSLERRLRLIEINAACLNTSLAEKQIEAMVSSDQITSMSFSQLSADDQIRFFLIAGDNYRLRGHHRQAQSYYRRAYSMLRQGERTELLARCSERLALSYLQSKNGEEAERHGRQFHNYAMEVNDWKLLAHAELMRFRLQQFRSEYFRGYITFFNQRLQILDPMLKRLNMQNALAYVLSNETMITSMLKANEGIDDTIGYLKRAAEIANGIGNTHRLALAHHGLGICYQAIRRRKEAEERYRLAIEYAGRLTNSDLVDRLSNGVGYFFFSSGDYDTAAQYYNLALRGLSKSRDFEEICSSFFNFGSINFFLFRHREAIRYYEVMLKVMEPLGITNLQYHSREIIYSLIGICAIKTGDINKAYRYYQLAQQEVRKEDVYSTYEYFTYLKSLVSVNEDRLEDAIALMHKVIEIEENKQVDERYLVIRAYFELLEMEGSRGGDKQSVYLMDQIAELIDPGSFPFLRTLLTALKKGDRIPEALPIHPLKFNPELIIELAEQESAMRSLMYKMDEMRVITELQSMLQHHSTSGDLDNEELRFLLGMNALSRHNLGEHQAADHHFDRGMAILREDPRLGQKYLATFEYLRSCYFRNAERYGEAEQALGKAREFAMEHNQLDLLGRVIDSRDEEVPVGALHVDDNPLLIIFKLQQMYPSVVDFPKSLQVWDLETDSESYVTSRERLDLLIRYYGLLGDTAQLLVSRYSLDYAAIAEFSADELVYLDAVVPHSRDSDGQYGKIRQIMLDLHRQVCGGSGGSSNRLERAKQDNGFSELVHAAYGDRKAQHIHLLVGQYESRGASPEDSSRLLNITGNQLQIALEKLMGERRLLGEKTELERRVDERTRELRESIKQIEAQQQQILEYNRQLEGRVEQQGRELIESEQMATLGQLVANLSHEVSGPLGNLNLLTSSLAAQIEPLLQSLRSDELAREDLERFLESGVSSLSLAEENVNRVLELMNSYRKIAYHQAVPEAERFDLQPFLNNVLTLFEPRLRKRGIGLEFSCPAGLSIYSYPGVFSQILTNLLINAETHAFPEGFPEPGIEISISSPAAKDQREGEPRLIFSVKDNGTGISPETKARIFEAYFTTNKTGGGTGLGLHIVHTLTTDTLGGSISCFSEPGKGCEFRLEIPLRDEEK
jgi:signal transduction histidine kinase/tetratricopeptide (TPR) repeat protein